MQSVSPLDNRGAPATSLERGPDNGNERFHAAAGGEDPMFKSILIPTDGSELSQRAVRTAVELAKLHEARLTGIHVIPDYHLLIAYEGAFDPVTEERIEEEAKSRAEPYLEFVRKTAREPGLSGDTQCA